jgi:hypothetical protein
MNLPPPIQAYFDANKRLDADAMATVFKPDAVVHDEKRTHKGARAIRTWIDETSIGLPAVAVPQAIAFEGEAHRVTAQVSGKFAGSPVTLTFRFRLDGGHIAELDIA